MRAKVLLTVAILFCSQRLAIFIGLLIVCWLALFLLFASIVIFMICGVVLLIHDLTIIAKEIDSILENRFHGVQ